MSQVTIYFSLIIAMVILVLGAIFAFNSPLGLLVIAVGVFTGMKLQDPNW